MPPSRCGGSGIWTRSVIGQVHAARQLGQRPRRRMSSATQTTEPGSSAPSTRSRPKTTTSAPATRRCFSRRNISVVAWVNAASRPGRVKGVVSQGSDGGCSFSSYALYTGGSAPGPDGLRFYIWNGSTAVTSPIAPTTMWDGDWHMVAGTYDGSAVRMYLDGAEVGSGTAASRRHRLRLGRPQRLRYRRLEGSGLHRADELHRRHRRAARLQPRADRRGDQHAGDGGRPDAARPAGRSGHPATAADPTPPSRQGPEREVQAAAKHRAAEAGPL